MNQLVFIENNEALTDSLIVAEVFGKRHADVIKSIDTLSCSKEFTERNFSLSEYKDTTGRSLKKYLMKRDGLTFLIMGYTGSKAAEFKEKYIAEFNRMELELQKLSQPSYMIEDPVIRAKRWIIEQEEKQALAKQNEQLQIEQKQNEPLVNFAKVSLGSNELKLVREVAKVAQKEGLVIGEQRLWKKLREWGYIFKNSTEPTQKAMGSGYFQVIQRNINTPLDTRVRTTTKVTPKGQIRILHKLHKEIKEQGAIAR
ncbi:Rha family transcriptional regulator [Bacillus gobiensis]|uniref:Rha family transcriptional regulator n=1 Tax=Bacillus gobiensis TaxID=1441095 RepID=UPI003D1CC2DC